MMAVAVFHSISGSQDLWPDRPARKEALCLTSGLKRRGSVGLLTESECRLQRALLNVSVIATNVRKPPFASFHRKQRRRPNVRGGCYTQRMFDRSRVPFTIFLLITVLRQPRPLGFLVAFEGYARWAEVCVLGLKAKSVSLSQFLASNFQEPLPHGHQS
jgi:hypothetical protein